MRKNSGNTEKRPLYSRTEQRGVVKMSLTGFILFLVGVIAVLAVVTVAVTYGILSLVSVIGTLPVSLLLIAASLFAYRYLPRRWTGGK